MPVPHASVQYTSLKPASQPTTAVTGRHAVAGWPGIPQRLERKGFGRHAGAILDVLITFLPVMFFGEHISVVIFIFTELMYSPGSSCWLRLVC
jgi:hypothetical protein